MTRADAPVATEKPAVTTTSDPRPALRAARYRSRAAAALWALPVPILIYLAWDRGVHGGWTLPLGIQMRYLPTPFEVLRRLADLAVGGIIDDSYSGTLWWHLYASTVRVVQGFALAALVAIPLGIIMGRSRLVYRMVEPTINLIRPIPVTAWAPLALLIIGFGDRSTIFLVFLAAVFPVLLNTIAGVRAVPSRLFEAAAMLGTRPVRTLYKVVLPASIPGIVAGLRIALGLSWVILVVGETVGIRVGLGALITQAREQSRTDLIVAVMIVIGLAGFLADRILVLLVRLFARRRPLLPAAT
ncbi:ABC transporter permease [Nocardia sp. BMG51109]|uniref:ABC transporter permease n=1 Tax=Nocardia sp. BMG51109 TaxID=1056816 RepID=UPI000466AFDA|nr:ABC transporter permease [Nocardia sp. BMG51109]